MRKCKSIVLIDDDALENHVNRKLIQSLNITEHIELLVNGSEGIRYLKELCSIDNPPNLIFVDLNMSVMNGFEFLREIQTFPYEFRKDIKVIVLTSSLNEEDFEAANAIGCDGYLIKPLTNVKIMEEYEKVFYYED